MTVYGYARVSTKGQARDGNSLEAQEEMLTASGASEIYSDAFTGTKLSRPQFDKLISLLKPGDTLMVTKLDRIARSASKGSEMIQSLLDKGVKVHILNMGLIDNTPTGRLIINVMLAFAEFERDMIVQRTSEGKAVARTKEGYHEGRPKADIDMSAFAESLTAVSNGLLTVAQACTKLRISKPTFYKYKKQLTHA
jgi:DNA invertase Pin-like site-specific DNA recombinase